MHTQIGPYPVERLLAQGGMGAVYLGRHPQLGYEVAIKVLLAGRSASDDQRDRFRREVAALVKLDHPSLVTVLGEGEAQGVPWFAMRRVEGSNLAERLRREGPLPPAEVAELGKQLCAALSVAHDAGILHRDLKPENVLCTPSKQFVVTDFGLAKDLEVEESVRLSHTGMLQGTPGFWSPEQAAGEGGTASPATDVYGLGATLYAALTGKPPVDEETWVQTLVATRERPPKPPRDLRPEVPAWLERVVLRCLEKRPEDRYPSMPALHAALELGGAGATTKAGAIAAAIGAGLAVIALSLLALAWSGTDPSETAKAPPKATPPRAKVQATRPPLEPTRDRVRQVRRDLRRDPPAPEALRQARELLAGPGGSRLVDLRQSYVKAGLKSGPVLVSEGRQLPLLGLARWFDDQRIVVSSRDVRAFWRWNDWKRDTWERVDLISGQFFQSAAPAVFDGQAFVGGGAPPACAALGYPWDATTPTRTYATETSVTSIAAWGAASDRQLLAVGTQGTVEDGQGTILIFDLRSGERLQVLRGHRLSVNLRTAYGSKVELPVTGSPPEVCALAFSRDGRWLVSGGHAGDIIVWDVANGWTVHQTRAPTDGLIRDIALHPTRPLIAISTGLARAVHVLRIPGLEEETKLAAHERGFASGVRFSRDGRLLFSVSGEAGRGFDARVGELQVYDLETQRLIHKRSFSDQALNSIDLSPDGRRLVTYSKGLGVTGVLQVWEIDVPPGD